MVEALAAQFAAMAKEFKATQRQVAALEANLAAEVAQQARPPGALGVSAFESGLPLSSGFRLSNPAYPSARPGGGAVRIDPQLAQPAEPRAG